MHDNSGVLDILYFSYLESRIGYIIIAASDQYVSMVRFSDERPDGGSSNEISRRCARQLGEYFSGERRVFDVPVQSNGTLFQVSVWEELMRIPFGQQVTYSELALRLGNRNMVRAAGMACGRNRIPILVPCLRVVGKGGKLSGYSGGLWRKDWLIKHEMRLAGVIHQLDLFF